MRYNLSYKENKKKLLKRLRDISASDHPVVDVKKVNKKRTLSQNNYLHLLFSLYGLEFGYTKEEAKTQVKIALGYTYTKGNYIFFQRTSKMDTKELNTFIEKFRTYSSLNGLYLPKPNEVTDRMYNEIEANKEFL